MHGTLHTPGGTSQSTTSRAQARNSELRAKKAEAEEDAVRARERLADQQALLAERTAAHAAAKAELQARALSRCCDLRVAVPVRSENGVGGYAV